MTWRTRHGELQQYALGTILMYGNRKVTRNGVGLYAVHCERYTSKSILIFVLNYTLLDSTKDDTSAHNWLWRLWIIAVTTAPCNIVTVQHTRLRLYLPIRNCGHAAIRVKNVDSAIVFVLFVLHSRPDRNIFSGILDLLVRRTR